MRHEKNLPTRHTPQKELTKMICHCQFGRNHFTAMRTFSFCDLPSTTSIGLWSSWAFSLSTRCLLVLLRIARFDIELNVRFLFLCLRLCRSSSSFPFSPGSLYLESFWIWIVRLDHLSSFSWRPFGGKCICKYFRVSAVVGRVVGGTIRIRIDSIDIHLRACPFLHRTTFSSRPTRWGSNWSLVLAI
jgi:hypothetical protein